VSSGGTYTTKCASGGGLKTAGERCYSNNECRAGLFCVGGVDAKCTYVCCPGDADPCHGGLCNTQFNTGNQSYYMYVCSFAPECKLLIANACEPGLDCHVEDAKQGLATCGSPSGNNVPELGECKFLNDCDDMQQCQQISSTKRVCLYYCYLDQNGMGTPGLGGCPAGEACVSQVGNYKIDFHIPNVGVCYPPGGIKDAGAPDASDAGDAADDDGGQPDAAMPDADPPDADPPDADDGG
jgi:hypothetical protein